MIDHNRRADAALEAAEHYLELLEYYRGPSVYHAWVARHLSFRVQVALHVVADHPDQARIGGRTKERRLPMN